MIREWCKKSLSWLTMVLASDSAIREFTLEERNTLLEAHGILSRHQPGVGKDQQQQPQPR